MTPERDLGLPPAPRAVHDRAGQPAFGTYQGELGEVDLGRLTGRYHLSAPRRLLKHKRWQYSLVATPELLAAFAIVDLSYAANAFAVAVDLRQKRVLFDESFMGLPGPLARVGDRPGEGLQAKFRTLGARLACERGHGHGHYGLDVDVRAVPFLRPALRCQAEVQAVGGSPPLTVIAPVSEDGLVNITQKRAALPTTGSLSVGGRTYSLDGGLAGLDYTHGYLARHTAWRWALALGRLPDGTPVGLNLVEGINDGEGGASENALWIGSRLLPLPRAAFRFNPRDPRDEWHLTTADGAINLRFHPLHVHREERDYKVVKSHFLQPLGTFEGTVRQDGQTFPVALSGVAEDQDILW